MLLIEKWTLIGRLIKIYSGNLGGHPSIKGAKDNFRYRTGVFSGSIIRLITTFLRSTELHVITHS